MKLTLEKHIFKLSLFLFLGFYGFTHPLSAENLAKPDEITKWILENDIQKSRKFLKTFLKSDKTQIDVKGMTRSLGELSSKNQKLVFFRIDEPEDNKKSLFAFYFMQDAKFPTPFQMNLDKKEFEGLGEAFCKAGTKLAVGKTHYSYNLQLASSGEPGHVYLDKLIGATFREKIYDYVFTKIRSKTSF